MLRICACWGSLSLGWLCWELNWCQWTKGLAHILLLPMCYRILWRPNIVSIGELWNNGALGSHMQDSTICVGAWHADFFRPLPFVFSVVVYPSYGFACLDVFLFVIILCLHSLFDYPCVSFLVSFCVLLQLCRVSLWVGDGQGAPSDRGPTGWRIWLCSGSLTKHLKQIKIIL